MTPNLPAVIAVLPAVVVGLLLPLAIVGLVAYGIAELVRAGSDRPAGDEGERAEAGTPSAPASTSEASPAITILDERFARGEIDTEDYVQRRELLLASLGAASPAAVAPADPAPPVDAVTPAEEGMPGPPTAAPAEDATGEQPSTDEQPPATG